MAQLGENVRPFFAAKQDKLIDGRGMGGSARAEGGRVKAEGGRLRAEG
jgi:hypothetical protein